MSEQNKGKIQALTVQNFTCFEDVSFEFSTGINVFIGENGTGKTHILKLLYAILSNNDEDYAYEKLLRKTFKEGISELLREKKVVDIGPIEINKKENKRVAWPLYAGGIALIAGIVLVAVDKKGR